MNLLAHQSPRHRVERLADLDVAVGGNLAGRPDGEPEFIAGQRQQGMLLDGGEDETGFLTSLIAGQPGMHRLPGHPTLPATCEIDNPSLMTAKTA